MIVLRVFRTERTGKLEDANDGCDWVVDRNNVAYD